jgi:hypothetical protein
MILIAQLGNNPYAQQQSVELLQQSFQLAQDTNKAWSNIWESVISPTSQLWQGLLYIGLLIATVSILYLAMTSGREAVEKQDFAELGRMFIWPLVIALFIKGNGSLLANSVLLVRNVADQQIAKVLEFEVEPGYSITAVVAAATKQVLGKAAVEAAMVACSGESGQAKQDCLKSKIEPLQKIKRVVLDNPVVKSIAGAFGDFIDARISGIRGLNLDPKQAFGLGNFITNPFIPVLKGMLTSLQWAFVNVLEAALLLTALYAPIGFGLSLLPFQGRPIWAWLIGFLSLYGLKLGYYIIVGLCATVLLKSQSALVSDLAFLTFLSIFAPLLATLIAAGGGIALWQGMQNAIGQVANLMSSALSSVTAGLTGFATKAVGK